MKIRAMGSVLEGRTWIQVLGRMALMPSSSLNWALGKVVFTFCRKGMTSSFVASVIFSLSST